MKKSLLVETTAFPLSKTKITDGTRRLAREKVLQTLVALNTLDSDKDKLFEHIFYRDFVFDDVVVDNDRVLRKDEVNNLEFDAPIQWKERDEVFGKKLLNATLTLNTSADERIERLAKNWELERIALIDRHLLRMAIAEFINCEDIPLRVTINECIELSKRYSTDKSNVFINGVLDAACEELKAEGEIHKTGTGIDNQPVKSTTTSATSESSSNDEISCIENESDIRDDSIVPTSENDGLTDSNQNTLLITPNV